MTRLASIHRWLKKRRRWAKDYRKFIRKEIRWKVPIFTRQPRWVFRGFLSSSAVLYELDRKNYHEYVSDAGRYTKTSHMVHGSLQEILNNKLSFYALMNSVGVSKSIVPIYGIVVRGGFHPFPTGDRIPFHAWLKSLSPNTRLFVKPLKGTEGRWVRSVTRTDEGFSINGHETDLDEFLEWVERRKRPLMVERAVEQHSSMSDLFPGSINTVRMLTALDFSSDRRPFVSMAVLRIGSHKSNHVDNWTQGGLSSKVNLDTGELGSATRMPNARNLEWFPHHPDTGAVIQGRHLPYWEEAVQLVLYVANCVPYMEYVGWDIILSPKGPVLLEGNINSGLNVLQVHGALLSDDRMRRYYTKRGAI